MCLDQGIQKVPLVNLPRLEYVAGKTSPRGKSKIQRRIQRIPKKDPNKIITINRRRGMHYVEPDLHGSPITVVDECGNRLPNKKIPGSLAVLRKEPARIPVQTLGLMPHSSGHQSMVLTLPGATVKITVL